MTIEDNIRSELAEMSEDVRGGPSLDAAIATGRSRRTRRHLAAAAGSAAAVTSATLITASLVGGGPDTSQHRFLIMQPAAQPRSGTSGPAAQSFPDFVAGTNVDESMQAAIDPNLPADANAVVTSVYPSDWSRDTPLPDGQAENATDWQADYTVAGGQRLRVVMGLPVPYETSSGDPCGRAAGSCTTRADGSTVEVYAWEDTYNHVFIRTASITGTNGFQVTATESVDGSSASPDGPVWTLSRDELVAVADSQGLTFPAPVVTPSTDAPSGFGGN